MALANKDHIPKHNSTMAIIQASAFYDRNFARNSSNDVNRIITTDKTGSPEKSKNHLLVVPPSNSSSVSSPSSTNSNGLGYQAGAGFNLAEEDQNSVITFKPAEFGNNTNNPSNNLFCSNGPFLSFDAAKRMPQTFFSEVVGDGDGDGDGDEYPAWAEDGLNLNQQLMNGLSGIPYAAASSNGLRFDWMNDEEANNGGQDLDGYGGGSNKRSYTGEESNYNQVVKKQCAVATDNNGSKKPNKAKSASPSKDTQSIAAKNRRERISERLKILQDLVPNGSKVDLVTMLEKAISYVKFLQLQVKVLATDEFWPAQGGKAPDLSQVREAIDAILASQRSDRNSTSK